MISAVMARLLDGVERWASHRERERSRVNREQDIQPVRQKNDKRSTGCTQDCFPSPQQNLHRSSDPSRQGLGDHAVVHSRNHLWTSRKAWLVATVRFSAVRFFRDGDHAHTAVLEVPFRNYGMPWISISCPWFDQEITWFDCVLTVRTLTSRLGLWR